MIDFAEIIRKRLRTGLMTARKARDDISSAVYRSLIAVLDNAGSVPVDLSGPAMQTRGTADVPRTLLDHEDVTELLRQEHEERITASKDYRSYGREQEAAGLEAQAIVIEHILEEWKKEVS
jgi:hypothetical protein